MYSESDKESDTSTHSSSSDNSDISSSEEKILTLPTHLKGNQLRRLILIDGFNIMHAFKDMGLQDPVQTDEKMCPLILLPLLCNLMQNDFNVKIIMKNMPDVKKASDLYILETLHGKGFFRFHKEDDTEKDDLLLLELAKQFGAIIITKDQFRNHKGFEDIAENNRIEYDKCRTPFFNDKIKESSEILKRSWVYKYTIGLHDSPNKFLVNPNDEDYDRVKRSHQVFAPPSNIDAHILKLLTMYTYCSWCYVYGYDVPECASKFISSDAFPMSFADFEDYYIEFEEAHRRSPPLRKNPPKDSQHSDDDE